MNNQVENCLIVVIRELCGIIRGKVDAEDLERLAADLGRSAAFTARLEKVARSLRGLDAQTPAK